MGYSTRSPPHRSATALRRRSTGVIPRSATMVLVSTRQVLLLALGVVAVSFSAIFIRLSHAPALSIALYRNAISAAIVLPPMLVLRRAEVKRLTRTHLALALLAGHAPLAGFPPSTWGLFLLMAIVPQMLGHTVFNYLLKDVDATLVAIAIMGEPVGSTLLALVFFAEVPPWTAVAGGALILAGIYVAVTVQARMVRPTGVAVPLE